MCVCTCVCVTYVCVKLQHVAPPYVDFFFFLTNSLKSPGIPWQSSGQDSTLPLEVVWVVFLVRELKVHTPGENKFPWRKFDMCSHSETDFESLSNQTGKHSLC